MTTNTNSSFYVTCCNTCKLYGDNLKTCSGCRMVSYCCYEHQKEDWLHHRDICKSVSSILKANNWKSLFNRQKFCSSNWVSARSGYMLQVELLLRRKLTTYEKQIFMFPNVCAYCKMFSGTSEICCRKCSSIKYCSVEHSFLDKDKHDLFCDELQLCFMMDMNICKMNLIFESPPRQEAFTQLPSDIDTFISSYANIKGNSNYRNAQQKIGQAYYSELLSCPLTLLYVCEKEEIKTEKLIVHIVGSSSFESSYIFAWESIFHWVPHLKSLHLVFIGPECVPNSNFNLCSHCEGEGRNIIIEYYPSTFYHDYIKNDSFIFPNISLAFNCGFHEHTTYKDTWSESIPFLLRFKNVPLVLTSYTQEEAKADLLKVRNILGDRISVSISCKKNPFSSKRPYRDWESDPLMTFCANSYLTVIRQI